MSNFLLSKRHWTSAKANLYGLRILTKITFRYLGYQYITCPMTCKIGSPLIDKENQILCLVFPCVSTDPVHGTIHENKPNQNKFRSHASVFSAPFHPMCQVCSHQPNKNEVNCPAQIYQGTETYPLFREGCIYNNHCIRIEGRTKLFKWTKINVFEMSWLGYSQLSAQAWTLKCDPNFNLHISACVQDCILGRYVDGFWAFELLLSRTALLLAWT